MAAKHSDNTTTADLKDQAGVISDDLMELGRLAKEVLAERADELSRRARRTAGAARERASDLSDGVADSVRERPFRGLAIAAGVGALIGILFSRR